MSSRIKVNAKGSLVDQLVSYHVSQEDALNNSTKYTRYFLGSGGSYKMVSTELGVVTTQTSSVTGMPEPILGIDLSLPCKVPYGMFLQIFSFFKDVYETRKGAEAMVQIYWDRDKKEYFLYCPEQKVDKARVEFKRNTDLDSKFLLVADIHSHNDGPASFSSIDDNDELEPRIYGVVGKVNTSPEVSFRVSTGRDFALIDMYDLFDNPYPDAEYPKEWLKNVTPTRPLPSNRTTLFDKHVPSWWTTDNEEDSTFDSYSIWNSYGSADSNSDISKYISKRNKLRVK